MSSFCCRTVPVLLSVILLAHESSKPARKLPSFIMQRTRFAGSKYPTTKDSLAITPQTCRLSSNCCFHTVFSRRCYEDLTNVHHATSLLASCTAASCLEPLLKNTLECSVVSRQCGAWRTYRPGHLINQPLLLCNKYFVQVNASQKDDIQS